jgi:hypothetical protein
MVKTMRFALQNETCSFAAVFEDDASPSPGLHNELPNIIRKYKPIDVLYMDSRNIKATNFIPGCCLMATIYSRRAMQFLSTSMDHKTSAFMKFYATLHKKNVDNKACLNDWMLANFLGMTTLRVSSHPLVNGHGRFASQLS